MALLMGVAGSLHCAGMCGAIMCVMPFRFFKGAGKVAAIVLYHFGRTSVYAAMAVVLHFFRDAFDPRVQQYISVALGFTLLLAGVFSFLPLYSRLQFKLPWGGFVKNNLGRFIGNPGLPSIMMAGALNGLLPCGLVYMALSATFAMPSASGAAFFMYSFGLGTVPALVCITLLRQRISFVQGGQLKKLVPVVVLFFGCLFVLRGLNLGIPYLSPKVDVTKHQIHSCCHKN
jgi:sulfite exporter TauE/SafE